MNYTNSGIIAQGAPMSKIRILSELKNSMIGEECGRYHLLLLTDEGNLILDALFRNMGCDPRAMDMNSKSTFLADNFLKVDAFLRGVAWGAGYL